MVEVGVGVPENGPWDMTLLICRPADIHLDHAYIWVVEVLRKPDWLRKHIRKRRTVGQHRKVVCHHVSPCINFCKTVSLGKQEESFSIPIVDSSVLRNRAHSIRKNTEVSGQTIR